MLTRQLLERANAVDVNNIDENMLPYEEVQDGDTVVGVLPDDLKRLYVVITNIHREQHAACVEFHAQFDPIAASGRGSDDLDPDEREVMYRHDAGHKWDEVLKKLFWAEVANEFPALMQRGVNSGLREGWQVVSIPSTCDTSDGELGSLGGILASLMGVGG